MVREASITQDEVNAAADKLFLLTGKKPTARAVREYLGNRGSMVTVQKLLKAWENKNFQPPQTAIALPQSLYAALADFISQEIANGKAILEADLKEVQQENADLISESGRQASEIANHIQQIESLTAMQSELNGRMNQLTADLEISRKEAEEQRQAAEKARTEQAKLQLRLEGVPHMESEIKRLQVTLEAERATRVKAEQDAAVAIARLEKTDAQAQDLQTRLARAEAEAAQAGDRTNALWEQLLGAKESVT